VKINLKKMSEPTCAQSYVIESYDTSGRIKYTGTAASNPLNACVHVLDLATLHPRARGFRRGFLGYPYGYLSAGTYDVLVRMDLTNYTLSNVKIIDLFKIDPTYGGYSGGFTDGNWACFWYVFI
jgi:hypothetical protein